MKKHIALAFAAALLGTAASAANNNSFGIQHYADAGSTIELDLVRADSAGTVEIIDNLTGVRGPVLGQATVAQGANADVRVQLQREPVGHVVAVLDDADGNAVAERLIRLND